LRNGERGATCARIRTRPPAGSAVGPVASKVPGAMGVRSSTRLPLVTCSIDRTEPSACGLTASTSPSIRANPAGAGGSAA
jgi:hypothetical protein